MLYSSNIHVCPCYLSFERGKKSIVIAYSLLLIYLLAAGMQSSMRKVIRPLKTLLVLSPPKYKELVTLMEQGYTKTPAIECGIHQITSYRLRCGHMDHMMPPSIYVFHYFQSPNSVFIMTNMWITNQTQGLCPDVSTL